MRLLKILRHSLMFCGVWRCSGVLSWVMSCRVRFMVVLRLSGMFCGVLRHFHRLLTVLKLILAF